MALIYPSCLLWYCTLRLVCEYPLEASCQRWDVKREGRSKPYLGGYLDVLLCRFASPWYLGGQTKSPCCRFFGGFCVLIPLSTSAYRDALMAITATLVLSSSLFAVGTKSVVFILRPLYHSSYHRIQIVVARLLYPSRRLGLNILKLRPGTSRSPQVNCDVYETIYANRL